MIMNAKNRFLGSLALVLVLAGCGEGGGGVASTPTPPAAATYTKIVDMAGDRTFQTGGIQYQTGPGINFTQAQKLAFGSGITVAYTAASDSYRLTAPDSTTVTVTPPMS
ncbi:MAG: hypothetical protein ABJA20_08455 [Novosphingobium sp.]